jgi:hypothetical protein
VLRYSPTRWLLIASCRKAWLLFALLMFARSSTRAQNVAACQQRSIVNVSDQQGKLVPGLQPRSFQGSLRGQSVRILSATVQSELPRVVLLLDISGSVNRENHNLELAQFAAGNFVATSAIPHVALVLFSDSIRDELGFETEPKNLLLKLANLNDGRGRTALFDSLMYSAGLFDTPKAGDTVYLITDGFDNHSKSHSDDVAREFLSRGIRLFCFILWPTHQDDGAERSIYVLQHLTEVTGGSVTNARHDDSSKGREWLKASLLRAYTSMKSFYELDVEFPRNLDTPHSWELQVVDDHGKRRKDIEVSYAKRLVPCALAPPQKR